MIAHFKNYLSITKQQWNGYVILLVLLMLILAWPYAYKRLRKDTIINMKAIDKAAALLNHKYHLGHKYAKNANNTAYKSPYTRKVQLTIPIDLNTADSAQLTTVYGIGPVFAGRIIKYRKRVGVFINKEQLRDVYGFNDEKYTGISPQVKVNPAQVQKININTATFDELKHLPYLTYKQMNAIEQYRIQHGDYTGAGDLKEIVILNDNIINKIKPYLSFK
jgi:competence protein ComEA